MLNAARVLRTYLRVARLFRHCSRSFGDYRANRKTVGGLALASAASAGGGLLAAPRLAAQFWTGESASTSVNMRIVSTP